VLISKPSGNALPEGSLIHGCCFRFAQGINFDWRLDTMIMDGRSHANV